MNATDQIRESIQELDEHLSSAPYRVRAYYKDPKVTEFEDAPHDQQFRQAAAFIDYSISVLEVPRRDWEETHREMPIEWLSRRDWSRQMISDLIIGIAIELVVSAAHLKIDSNDYLNSLAKKEVTPRYGTSKSILLEDLRNDIPEDRVEEIELVLELAKKKRNNLKHFGFHTMRAHYYPQLFITVCGFLITHYADTDEIPELQTMKNFCEDYHEARSDAEMYPVLGVDFEPFD